MNKLIILFSIIFLLASSSGCLDNSVPINQTRMADHEEINAFCQAKGYDSGRTEIQDPYSYYEYKKTHDSVGGFQYELWGREIICTKTETKQTNILYDYNDFYKWTKNI